ncbi:MAG: cytochrome C biosynthesis protein [Peptoniphilus sp.]|nr:cytochrome C biosynthesis protein [Peptoniphilus sp.]MDY3118040.1 cytochrome C biosynthesis protein [Peptoniphilus sp.]
MLGKVSESLNGNLQYIGILVLAVVVALILTFVINMMGKQMKFMRYLPGLALVFIGMFSLIMVLNRLFERSSLTNIFISVVCITAGICALLFALCIGIYNKDRYPDGQRENERRKREN